MLDIFQVDSYYYYHMPLCDREEELLVVPVRSPELRIMNFFHWMAKIFPADKIAND